MRQPSCPWGQGVLQSPLCLPWDSVTAAGSSGHGSSGGVTRSSVSSQPPHSRCSQQGDVSMEQRRGEGVKPRDQESPSCGQVTDSTVASGRGRRTVSLKESSRLQQDGHLALRVALTGVPSLQRGRGALRCQPAAGTPSTASGTRLERTTCLLNGTSAPHDIVPPPPVSPQPGLSQPPRQRDVA